MKVLDISKSEIFFFKIIYLPIFILQLALESFFNGPKFFGPLPRFTSEVGPFITFGSVCVAKQMDAGGL